MAKPALASDVPSLSMCGNDDVLWIFQRKPDESGTLHLHFSFCLPTENQKECIFRPHIPGLTGGIARATLRGTDLHTIYRDGTHWRYQAQVFSRLPTAKPLRVIERNIPGNVAPIAIGSDRKRPVIYAIITARQANEMIKLELKALAWHQEIQNDDNFNVKAQPSPLTPTKIVTSDYAIIRYENGRWQMDRQAPADFTLVANVSTLIGDDGVIHLVYEDTSTRRTYHYKKSADTTTSWSTSSPISFESPIETIFISMSDQSPMLLASLQEQNGLYISSHLFQDGTWQARPVLSDNQGHTRLFSRPVAVSIFTNSIVVARQDADHVVSVGRWSLETGLPIAPAKTVDALQSSPLSAPQSHVRTLIQYGILGGILTVVFLRRRESVSAIASIKDDQLLAPFARRFAAFLIDLSILFPTWGALIYRQMTVKDGGMTAFERMAAGEQASPNEIQFWLMAIIGAIFGLYSFIFEVANGATPGKRIAGITVVSDQGMSCSYMALLIRNLMRPIEFYFPPVMLLLAVTPSRQRLGDLLARSVVILPDEASENSGDSQNHHEENSDTHVDEKA